MARLSTADLRAIGQLGHTLDTLGDPACYGPEAIAEPMNRLMRSQAFIAHTFEATPAGTLRIARQAMVHVDGPHNARRMHARYDQILRESRTVNWTLYNPIRPEAHWRNRAVLQRWSIVATKGDTLPVVGLFRETAVYGLDQCRVLVCDGSSLLAWVGVCRQEPFTARELRLMGALVPHLRRRLRLERELRGASSLGMLEAVLDTLGAPAFVLGRRGTIEHANALGLALWSRDARGLGASLASAMQSPQSSASWQLTPLRYPGLEGYWLAIRREAEPGGSVHVAEAARRWALTPRQREVLALIARGLTNKTIAAELGCAEVTVEFHVSALLEKAQAENRAALVAKVWSTAG